MFQLTCFGARHYGGNGYKNKASRLETLRPSRNARHGHRIKKGRSNGAAIGARLGFQFRQAAIDLQRRFECVSSAGPLWAAGMPTWPATIGATDWLAAPLSKKYSPRRVEIGENGRQRLGIGEKALASKIGHTGITGEARHGPAQTLDVGFLFLAGAQGVGTGIAVGKIVAAPWELAAPLHGRARAPCATQSLDVGGIGHKTQRHCGGQAVQRGLGDGGRTPQSVTTMAILNLAVGAAVPA